MCSIYARRSWKRKKLLDLTVFFAFMGSAFVKATCKMLVKLSPACLHYKIFCDLFCLSFVQKIFQGFFVLGKTFLKYCSVKIFQPFGNWKQNKHCQNKAFVTIVKIKYSSVIYLLLGANWMLDKKLIFARYRMKFCSVIKVGFCSI